MNNQDLKIKKVFEVLKNHKNSGNFVEDPVTILRADLVLQRWNINEILKRLERRGLIIVFKSGVAGIGGGLIIRVKILRDSFPRNPDNW